MENGNGVNPQRPGRSFACDGVEWRAWPSGASAYGTGTCGPAALDAVHFARGDAPDVAVYEALLPAGRFFALFDEELIGLLRAATRVVDPSERPLKPSRRGEGLF